MAEFALKVADNGMRKFHIEADDFIHIDTTAKIKSGDFVAILYPNTTALAIRRMTRKNGCCIFESYGKPEIYEEAAEDIPKIIGKAVALYREI